MNDTVKAKSEAVDVEVLKDEIDSLRKNIATLARHVGNGTGGKIIDEGQHLYGRLHDGSERAIRVASHEIEERPLTSVLIAFAAGFVGGKLLSR
ncbi:MAG TPA: hypothetical protein VGG27_09105 [Magnetospirillaceae bacterium]|jgi:ElaB/YqjD/DUF883 family membrane-anchored ribosome-binding protein